MKYKAPDNSIHVVDAGFEYLLPAGSVQVTDEEAQAILNPPLTPEQLQATIVAAIQLRLDNFARTRGYDGILSACTYATSTVPKFAGEAQYCVQARDATWAAAYAILADVQAQERAMPTVEEALAEMPALAWPA